MIRTYLLVCFLFIGHFAQAQSGAVSQSDASDPTTMKSRFDMDIESYLFFQNAQFFVFRPGYHYGLQNEKHLFGISIPFVHSVFNQDLQGYENTTGLGDIRMSYTGAIATGKIIGMSKVSPYFEATAPTGEYLLGRGAGAWVYNPGIIFTYTADQAVTFYPEIRYQFSGSEANSRGGNGLPDPNDPQKDNKISNLTFQLPVVIQLESSQAWISINTWYTQSFTEKEYYVFIRTDFGKMIGPKTSASLQLAKFVAGQPRLNVTVQAKFLFFL